MISKLIAIRIRSNGGILAAFFAIHAASFGLVFGLTERDYGVAGLDTLEREMLTALTVFLVMAIFILIREQREQREQRSQFIERLPVSMRQAFLADWSFAAICICVPMLFWVAAIVLITDVDGSPESLPSLVFWTTFFFLLAGALFGLLREVIGHSVSRIRLKGLVSVVALVVLGFALIVLATMRGGFTWPQLYALALLASAGLIGLDFHNRRTVGD